MKTLNAVVTVDIDETLPNDFDLTLPETKKKREISFGIDESEFQLDSRLDFP